MMRWILLANAFVFLTYLGRAEVAKMALHDLIGDKSFIDIPGGGYPKVKEFLLEENKKNPILQQKALFDGNGVAMIGPWCVDLSSMTFAIGVKHAGRTYLIEGKIHTDDKSGPKALVTELGSGKLL